MRSESDANGLRTVLDYQVVGPTRYFDAAGFTGHTVGLHDAPVKSARSASATPERD